jgi:hypothetical protein
MPPRVAPDCTILPFRQIRISMTSLAVLGTKWVSTSWSCKLGDYHGGVEQRDAPIDIDDSGFSQAEDVFGGGVWLG